MKTIKLTLTQTYHFVVPDEFDILKDPWRNMTLNDLVEIYCLDNAELEG